MAENGEGGLVTWSAEVYICPACREGVQGFFKYVFVIDPDAVGGPQPQSVVPGKLEVTGAVIPEHNCIPKVKR